jgi:hypothetical protein
VDLLSDERRPPTAVAEPGRHPAAERVASVPSSRTAPGSGPGTRWAARVHEVTKSRGISVEALAAIVLTLLCLVPVIVVVATMWGRPYFPLQDLAVVDLRVRDVWTMNTPLVGPYSREFNHPGPMFYWVLAIPSLLAGKAAWATLVGSAIVMGIAIAATARVAWRASGIALVIVVLAASTMPIRESFLYLHSWNPNTALPFYILLLVLVAATAAGDLSRLLWVAVVGSFLLQAHVGYLTVVATPIVVLAVVLFRVWRRDPERVRGLRRQVLKASGVALVLWIPPAAQQVFGHEGNLSAMLEYSRATEDQAVGLTHALGLLATDFRWRPTWLGGSTGHRFPGIEELPSSAWWLLIPVALVVVAGYMLRRAPSRDQRERVEAYFFAFASVSCVAAIPALAQVRAPVESYLFRWRAPLAVAVLLSALLVIGRRLPGKQIVLPLAAITVTALTLSNAFEVSDQVARGDDPRPGKILPFEPIAVDMAREALNAGLPRKPFLMRSAGDPNGGVYEGLADEFIRRGAPVRVDPWFEFKWGHRAAKKQEVDRVVYVTTVGSLADRISTVRSARVLSRVTPLSRSEERLIVELQARVLAETKKVDDADAKRVRGLIDSPLVGFAMTAAGITLPRRDVERLVELNRKVARLGCRCAVIDVAVDDAPF